MGPHRKLRPRENAGAALLGALLVALTALGLPAARSEALEYPAPDEWELTRWINAERRWNGLEPLTVDGQLTGQAQLQADRMALCGCLRHSPPGELAWYVNPMEWNGWGYNGWAIVGENVAATNGDLWSAHVAVMRSPDHLAILLDGRHDAVGVAIRRSRGNTYVAEVFGG